VFRALLHIDAIEDLMFYHFPRDELLANGKVNFHGRVARKMETLTKSSCTPLQDIVTKGLSHAAIREMMRTVTENIRSPEPEVSLAESPVGWKAEAKTETILVKGAVVENGKGENPQEGGTELLESPPPFCQTQLTTRRKEGP
jgi:hypothetical protein